MDRAEEAESYWRMLIIIIVVIVVALAAGTNRVSVAQMTVQARL